jgi:drug/metabolite transporter (DMT)-like permease
VFAVDLGVPAGTVALVAALQPITASVAAGPILGERVSQRQWAGLIIGLAGVAMVVGADLAGTSTAPGWAYLLPFLAMASLVTATLLDRRAVLDTSVADGLTVQTTMAAAIFVALSAATGTFAAPLQPMFWVAVGWTIVFSHFAGYALYWLNVRRGGVTRVGLLLYLTPGTTAIWAAAMFGQPISGLAAVGMAISLVSVAFAVKP